MVFSWLGEICVSVLNTVLKNLLLILKKLKPTELVLTDLVSESEDSSKLKIEVFDPEIDKFLDLLNLETIYDKITKETYVIMEHIIKAVVFYLFVCLCIYKLIFWSKVRKFFNFFNNIRLPKRVRNNILIVTAHPDDESMFFGPLIYTLTQQENCQVYLLCLSNGNYEKQGHMRRDELWQACEVLGVKDCNVILINASNLPDDPNVEWKPEVVGNLILNTIERYDVNSVFTFDREGISQHLNHCSIYYAVASLCLAKILPKNCKVYTLDSINIVRKYLSIFDIVCTCVMSKYWCILSWKHVSIIKRAMKQHKSQLKWFRWLYIYFSRYMIINSFNELYLYDIELEMQLNQ